MKVKSTILILFLCIMLVDLQASTTPTTPTTATTSTTEATTDLVIALIGDNSTTTMTTLNETTTDVPTTTPTTTTTTTTKKPTTTTTTIPPQEPRFPIAKGCQMSGTTGDCANLCALLSVEEAGPFWLIVLTIVEVLLLIIWIVLACWLFFVYRPRKQQRPHRPIRTAEPLAHIAEGAIDPVMSPAPDEVDAEGAIIAPKTKFDKNSPDVRLKHRQYMEFMRKQERSDADSKKFKKCPPIFIPAFVDDAQFAKKCEDPDNIILENVVYDPSGNELYEIGSDVDNIELNPSSILTLTEDSQKASTMKTMKAPKTAVGSATQLKSVAQLKTANLKSSKKSRRGPKTAQPGGAQQPPKSLMNNDKKSLVEKSFQA